MAITEAYSGTASISTTEYSCPNAANYSSGSAITDDGVYQVFLDTSALAITNQLQIRIYEKCRSGDTQRIIYEAFITGTTADTWVSPSLILLHGWDVTLNMITGSAASVNWSIRKVA